MCFLKKQGFFILAVLSISHVMLGMGRDPIDPNDFETPSFMKALYERKKHIKKTKASLLASLPKNSNSSCDTPTPITQADLPFTTPGPGKYCIKENLSFNGPNAAITVIFDDVCIDFDCHSLTLNPINTQGIVAANISNLQVKNGSIHAGSVSSDANSAAVGLTFVDRILFDNMFFNNTNRGIVTGVAGVTDSGCIDLEVTNSKFNHPHISSRCIIGVQDQGVTLENCIFEQVGSRAITLQENDRNIRINKCHFLNTNKAPSRGIQVFNSNQAFPEGTQNVEVTDCDFSHFYRAFNIIGFNRSGGILIKNCIVTNNGFPPQGDFSNSIEILDCNNILIEDCLLHSDPSSNSTNLLIFGLDETNPSRSAIIRNCTMLNPESAEGFINVVVGNFQGCLFENCVFDSNSTLAIPGQSPGNVQFISTALGLSPLIGGKLLNCLFLNNPTTQFLTEPGCSDIVMEGCTLNEGIEQSILLQATSDSEIRDSSIVGSHGFGIVLTNGILNEVELFSKKNLIFQNNIQDNAKTSIVLENHSSRNTIKENVVSNNGTDLSSGNDGIFIDSTSNKNVVIGNDVFHNARDGIHNQNCPNNEFFENKACKNKRKNYVNVSPIVRVGSHPRAGANLECCNS